MKATLKRMMAVGGLSLAAGPLMAGVTWAPDGISTLFQDDNLDAVYEVIKPSEDPSTWSLQPKVIDDTAVLNVGDVLFAVFELPTSSGVPVLPDELTGLSVIEVRSIDVPNLAVEFQPYQGGLNNAVDDVLGGGTGFNIGSTGDVGGGAMLAMFLDPTPNLNIDAGLIPASGLSCADLATCTLQATDGDLWQVDGFGDDPDVYWESELTSTDFIGLENILNADLSTEVATFNAGLDILVNNTGRDLAQDAYVATGGPNPGVGRVDMIAGGSLKGGGGSPGGLVDNYPDLVDDGTVATSDLDLEKTAIPTPATLALLGAGLLGFHVTRRRKRG